MHFRHIVAAVDYSQASARALQAAARFARLVGGRLSVLHIREFAAASAERLHDFVSKWLDPARAPEAVDEVEEVGHPALACVDWAAENGGDMIFCGSHGRSGLARILLGSVAEKLVRHALCPVWVVRGTEDLHPRRILLPSDLSPVGETACRMAVYLAAGFDATLDVLHVIAHKEAQPGTQEKLDAFYGEVRKQAEQRLAQIGTDEKLAISRDIALGKPWERIVEYAKDRSSDLLVCGTHSRQGMERWVLGSVAEKLVRMAPCSVLVTPFMAGV